MNCPQEIHDSCQCAPECELNDFSAQSWNPLLDALATELSKLSKPREMRKPRFGRGRRSIVFQREKP